MPHEYVPQELTSTNTKSHFKAFKCVQPQKPYFRKSLKIYIHFSNLDIHRLGGVWISFPK